MADWFGEIGHKSGFARQFRMPSLNERGEDHKTDERSDRMSLQFLGEL